MRHINTKQGGYPHPKCHSYVLQMSDLKLQHIYSKNQHTRQMWATLNLLTSGIQNNVKLDYSHRSSVTLQHLFYIRSYNVYLQIDFPSHL